MSDVVSHILGFLILFVCCLKPIFHFQAIQFHRNQSLKEKNHVFYHFMTLIQLSPLFPAIGIKDSLNKRFANYTILALIILIAALFIVNIDGFVS